MGKSWSKANSRLDPFASVEKLLKMDTTTLTRAYIHLDRMSHNVRLLQKLVGDRLLWPAIKTNGYGHGIEIVARHLVGLGYDTLCVAHVSEAVRLLEAGIEARLLLLSATLPAHSEAIVMSGCEPVLCDYEMLESLGREAKKRQRSVQAHLMVDTGMGRIGIRTEEVIPFLDRCREFPFLRVRGLMSHFPCADETDKSLSLDQIEMFNRLIQQTDSFDIEFRHMANSAAIFDLPGSYFDAVRPGISIYGLAPSREIGNPKVKDLRPVLELKSRITFLKEVPEGTGLSYGHAFHTRQPSLIATVPVGYGDGYNRRLSNKVDFLIGGNRCPQVGRITMDQSLVDVTALRGRVAVGDEVVLIGEQGAEEICADELAEKLGTINYEIVTGITDRVPRLVEEA